MSLDKETLIYENEQFEVHADPDESEGYIMVHKPSMDNHSGYMQFPRGTMEEITKIDDSNIALWRIDALQGNFAHTKHSDFYTCDALLTIRSAMATRKK